MRTPITKISSSLSLTCLAIVAGFLVACDRSEPHSYEIPKETREVIIPSKSVTAKVAPSDPKSTSSGMQVLPGMAEAAQAAGDLFFKTPANWEEQSPSGIRKAELSFSDGTGSAEITVTVFPGDVGGLLANVNRWRGQVGLSNITAQALADCTSSRPISNHSGTYVRLEGETRSIFGGLLPFHGKTWFFKMSGDTATAREQENALQEFLSSVRLEDTHH
jgi:glycine/D-amino acid oxidase-like deaminating enzyme